MPLSEKEVYGGAPVHDAEFEQRMPAVITDGSLIAGLTRAEMDFQVQVAFQHSRSVTKAQRSIETLATLDVETALSCVYRRPQKQWDPVLHKEVDTFIEGPSARFSEICLASWGNARVMSRQTDLTQEDVEATGIFHDLESNVVWAKSVRRPIVGKKGQRFPQHLITTTANAAASIALRNAILAGIPRAVWNAGYTAAYRTGKGDTKTLVARRENMLSMFKDIGVGQADVFTLLGVHGKEDISIDLMHTGAGLLNAIRDGEATLEELLEQMRAPRERPGLDAAFGDAPKEPAPPKPQATRPRASAAPAAEKPKATPESATGASTASAAETSGQKAPSAASPNGEAGFEMQEAEREATERPVTHVTGENVEITRATAEPEPEIRRGKGDNARYKETDAQAFEEAQAEAVMDEPDDHVDAEEQNPEPDMQTPTQGEPVTHYTVNESLEDHHIHPKPHETEAFRTSAQNFLNRVAQADSWLSIKPMVVQLRKWQADSNADLDAIKPLLLAAFRRTREISDPVKPGEDPVYARIYLLCEPPVEEAQKHYRALVRAAQYVRLTDDEKDVIAAEFEAYGG